MKKIAGIYLLLVLQVVIGVAVLVAAQQLPLTEDFRTAIIFLCFLVLNLLISKYFRLRDQMIAYWSLRKLYWLPVGAAAGALLIVVPLAVASATGALSPGTLQLEHRSLLSIIMTFLIIGWEELWFRSLLLNHGSRFLSKAAIAVTMGILFLLVHMLNPKIHLLSEGPALFLAGVLLTSVYFRFRNIWLPAGIHFGNNYCSPFVHANIADNRVYGENGYIYITILFITTVFFWTGLRKKNVQDFSINS